MQSWYIQIGVNMNQGDYVQIKQDVEQLVGDVKKLMHSDKEECSQEGCKPSCHNSWKARCHPALCIGLTALLAGALGGMIARKQES